MRPAYQYGKGWAVHEFHERKLLNSHKQKYLIRNLVASPWAVLRAHFRFFIMTLKFSSNIQQDMEKLDEGEGAVKWRKKLMG